MDEQRPQRQGYSDLNERQEEGVPALESDKKTGKGPDFPGAGPGDVSGTQPDMVRQAWTNEGRTDDATGSGQAEPAAGEGLLDTMSGGEDEPLVNEAAARADYEDPTTQTNPDLDPEIDATGLVDDIDARGSSGS